MSQEELGFEPRAWSLTIKLCPFFYCMLNMPGSARSFLWRRRKSLPCGFKPTTPAPGDAGKNRPSLFLMQQPSLQVTTCTELQVSKHLLSSYYVPGPGHTVGSKRDFTPLSKSLQSRERNIQPPQLRMKPIRRGWG